MSDGRDKELQQLQDELKQGKLSRRSFLDRLAGLGVGFGAAYVFGMRQAGARVHPSRGIQVSSTDAALNNILSEGGPGPQAEIGAQDPRIMTAQFPLPHPPPPLPHPPPPEPYYRYDRYTRVYDRGPYYRYERTYARYDRTYGR